MSILSMHYNQKVQQNINLNVKINKILSSLLWLYVEHLIVHCSKSRRYAGSLTALPDLVVCLLHSVVGVGAGADCVSGSCTLAPAVFSACVVGGCLATLFSVATELGVMLGSLIGCSGVKGVFSFGTDGMVSGARLRCRWRRFLRYLRPLGVSTT